MYKRQVLALGAQERPAPFPGWTLPGVLTVGAAQILLKTSRQVPAEPVWVAGSGPLPLLYMAQLLRAGGKVAGWLDTSPPGGWRRALPWLGDALSAWGDVSKGLAWLREILSLIHISFWERGEGRRQGRPGREKGDGCQSV